MKHKTAITRRKPSAPMQYLLTTNRLCGRMLDWGCGKGFDAQYFGMTGYDPYYCSTLPSGQFDTITSNYVLNVIKSPKVRQSVMRAILSYLKPDGMAYISVRNDLTNLNGYTKIGTWQGKVELDLPIVFKKSGQFIIYELSHAKH